jgi:hypothetical protein
MPVGILFLSSPGLEVLAGSCLASPLVCPECLKQTFRLLPQGMRLDFRFIPPGLLAFYAKRGADHKIVTSGFIDGA